MGQVSAAGIKCILGTVSGTEEKINQEGKRGQEIVLADSIKENRKRFYVH